MTIGQPAPGFTLTDSDLNAVSLKDFQGQKLVLLFFPLAFTGVCTKELCGVRDDMSRYQHAKAQILGISVDSPAALKRFKEDQQLNFTLLSDFNKEVSRAYGCIYENYFGMKGVSKRSAFVIDPKGMIRYQEVLENDGDLPDFEAINKALEQL